MSLTLAVKLLITVPLLLLAVSPGYGQSSAASVPITTIAEIRSLSREDAARALPVQVRGVVTWRYGRREFSVQDETGGTWIHLFHAQQQKIWQGDEDVAAQIREGLAVEVEGITHAAGYSPVIWPRIIRILGEKPLPTVRPLDRMRFFNGAEAGQRIEARGLVLGFQAVDVGWNLRMQVETDIIFVMVTKEVLLDPATVLDAEVLVRGVGGSGFNTRGEFLNARILVSVPADLVVERTAADAPFATHLVPLDQLRAFHPEPEKPRRLRIAGTVTYTQPGHFFYLQEGTRAVRVQSRSERLFQVGERVEAAGFVDMTRYIAMLGGADVRPVGAGQLPEPVAITPEQIMVINSTATNTGQAAQPSDFDGHLIRFRAQLLAVQSDPDGKLPWRRLALKQGSMILEAMLHQGDTASLDSLRPGSELGVTGLAQLEYANVEGTRSFLQPVRLGLLLRDATDLVVLRAPSWWTPRRLWSLLGVVALVLGGALLWVGQLRRQVKRKSHQLATEMRERRDAALEFQATLRERNRLAANLHDTLLQTLSGLNYQLEACEAESLPSAQRKANHLETARRMVERGQEDLRGTVWALRALPLKEQTMADALRALANQVGDGHDVKISVQGETAGPRLTDFVAGNLLLVAQEAMHNALKHARPKAIRVQMLVDADGMRAVLEVKDDGAGFSPNAGEGASTGHFGLQGMRERVERLGGRLQIESAPGRGTTVRAEVPLRAFDEEIA